MNTPARLSAKFHGNVQGVGFRYNTKNIAADFAIVGTVENLNDGSVQLCAEGDRSELEAFLARIKSHFEGNIESVDMKWEASLNQFVGFRIVR
jgi:acylphosphatase